MITESEVREKLAEVLQGIVPLEDFADWLAVKRRNMHKDSTAPAQALVGAISLLLYEFYDGYRTEAELLGAISDLLNNPVIAIQLGSPPSGLGSSTNSVVSVVIDPVYWQSARAYSASAVP